MKLLLKGYDNFFGKPYYLKERKEVRKMAARTNPDDYQEGTSGSEETGGVTGSFGDTTQVEGTGGSEETGGLTGSFGENQDAEQEKIRNTSQYQNDRNR